MTANWIPAALSLDLTPGRVLATMCGPLEVAVWRGASGRVSAWLDRCPHRGMRLSHGFVRGDMLSCIYHGWRYDGEGRCRKIPAHPDLVPPDAIRTQAIACTEAQGVIWVAAEAPTAPPPDVGRHVPLRSLTVEIGAEEMDATAGVDADGSVLRIESKGRTPALVLLLQPIGPGRIAVHALAAPATTEDLIAASRSLEDLRRRLEAKPRAA